MARGNRGGSKIGLIVKGTLLVILVSVVIGLIDYFKTGGASCPPVSSLEDVPGMAWCVVSNAVPVVMGGFKGW